jgi:hypothetical protein
VNVGVGYAISINQVKNFLGCLKSGRIVDHATLGATVSMGDSGGVRVSNILETSDAYRRGLRYDDEIVSFAGRPIDTPNGFKNVLGIFPKGWRVPLVYRRDKQEHSIVVRLTGVHAEEELIQLLQRRQQPEGEPRPDGKRPQRPGQPKRPGEEPPAPAPFKPDGQNPKPMPQRPGDPHAEPVVPPEVQKLILPRTGFANYYFNELNRDRVWNAFAKLGDFSKVAGTWKLIGELASGGKVEVSLADDASSGTFPQGAVKLDGMQDLDQQLGPAGSGGLLAALHLWRQMLVVGPQKFGDVSYYGTAPYAGFEGLADVLLATHNVAEINFVFDPVTGRLLALEMAAEAGADPCEIHFREYRDVAGRQVPHSIEVRHGDAVFGQIQWKQIELAPASQEEKP